MLKTGIPYDHEAWLYKLYSVFLTPCMIQYTHEYAHVFIKTQYNHYLSKSSIIIGMALEVGSIVLKLSTIFIGIQFRHLDFTFPIDRMTKIRAPDIYGAHWCKPLNYK